MEFLEKGADFNPTSKIFFFANRAIDNRTQDSLALIEKNFLSIFYY
jgi:hypothetical protein